MNRLICCLLLVLASACSSTNKQRSRNLLPDHDGAYTLWWNDDVKKEVGSARKGKRHGDVRRFYPDGSLEFRANFVDAVPHGRMEWYHKGGGLSRVETVDHGIIDGLREEYFANGSLLRRTPFVAGQRHGEETGWHADGTLALTRGWERDQRVGRWVEFDPNGRLLRTEHRWVAGGEEVGYIETVFAPTGQASAQTRLTRHDGVWRGVQTTWHDSGAQAGLVEFVAGKRHGRDMSWSRGGALVIQGERHEDLRHGVWVTWDEQGRIVNRAEYVHGVEQGAEAPSGGG